VNTIPAVPTALNGAKTLSFFTIHNGSNTNTVKVIRLAVREKWYPNLSAKDFTVSAKIMLYATFPNPAINITDNGTKNDKFLIKSHLVPADLSHASR